MLVAAERPQELYIEAAIKFTSNLFNFYFKKNDKFDVKFKRQSVVNGKAS